MPNCRLIVDDKDTHTSLAYRPVASTCVVGDTTTISLMLICFGYPRQAASTASNVQGPMFAVIAHSIRGTFARTVGAWEGTRILR
jgi:hypothetical protein